MPVTIGGSGTITGLSATGISAEPVFPGNILQVVRTVLTSSGTFTTPTIPFDNTIPQNTEGVEVMTATITPSSASNSLLIFCDFGLVDASTAGNVITTALFQDSSANAIAVSATVTAFANYSTKLSLNHTMLAGTTSATTFKVRIGVTGATGAYNRRTDANFYGGAAASTLTVMEVAG